MMMCCTVNDFKQLKAILSLLFSFVAAPYAVAQDTIIVPHPITAYINFAGGFNTINGLGGVQVEYFVSRRTSVIGGGGLGSWGIKTGVGSRFYLNDHAGAAFGCYYTFASGIDQVKLQDVEVINAQGIPETRSVDLRLLRLHAINLSMLYVFPLGKHHNRFFVEYGYSIPLQGKRDRHYQLKEPLILDKSTREVLRLLQPGGLTFSLGLSFPF